MKIPILMVVALAALSNMALAAPAHHHATVVIKKSALICPVTGDKIASVKRAVGKSTFKGKSYYFCCAGCKPRFDKQPATFVRNANRGKFEKM